MMKARSEFVDQKSVMVKARKYLRKQADKAELMAGNSTDTELAQSFASLARAYRSQADAMKAKKKSGTKKRRSHRLPRD
jgi:hypothetical protein